MIHQEDDSTQDLVREVVDLGEEVIKTERTIRYDLTLFKDDEEINQKIRKKFRRYRSKINYKVFWKRKDKVNREMEGKKDVKQQVEIGRPEFSESQTLLELDSYDLTTQDNGSIVSVSTEFFFDVQYNDLIVKYRISEKQSSKESTLNFELEEFEIDSRDIDEVKELLPHRTEMCLGLDPRNNLISKLKYQRMNQHDYSGWRPLRLTTFTDTVSHAVKSKATEDESEECEEVHKAGLPANYEKLCTRIIPRMRSYALKRKAEVNDSLT